MPEASVAPMARKPERKFSLPSPALALFYVAVCLTPLALATGQSVAPTSPWQAAAAGLGMVGLSAVVVQFITSGRFQVVSGRLGIDRVMAFHKIAAWWGLSALFLHPFLYVVPPWQANSELGAEMLWAYFKGPTYQSGVVAFGVMGLFVVSLLFRDRFAVRHETWRAIHLGLAIALVGFGVHHAVLVGRFSADGTVRIFWWAMGGLVLGVVLTLDGWRWAKLHLRTWRLAAVTKRADRIWEVDIQPSAGTRPLDYRAGQFVWITEGARRFPLFDHPFSIADSPERPGLSLIVKDVGDFTHQVGSWPVGLVIGIDGPYGHFTLQEFPRSSVLLVAGGVGIAPVMGLLRDLAARNDTRQVRLIYAAGTPENFACLPEIEELGKQLNLRAELVSETSAPGWNGRVGRIGPELLVEMLRGLSMDRTVAMICGPGAMMTAVADMLIDLGMPMPRIIYERFDYSDGSSRLDRRLRQRFLAVGAGLVAGLAVFVATFV